MGYASLVDDAISWRYLSVDAMPTDFKRQIALAKWRDDIFSDQFDVISENHLRFLPIMQMLMKEVAEDGDIHEVEHKLTATLVTTVVEYYEDAINADLVEQHDRENLLFNTEYLTKHDRIAAESRRE